MTAILRTIIMPTLFFQSDFISICSNGKVEKLYQLKEHISNMQKTRFSQK